MLFPVLTTYERLLTAADNAIKSAADAGDRTSRKVDKKFEKAIRVLNNFEKDFPSQDPKSDPSIGGTVTKEAKSDKSESPSTILYALRKNLHTKVNFRLFLYLLTLTNHSQWAINGRN